MKTRNHIGHLTGCSHKETMSRPDRVSDKTWLPWLARGWSRWLDSVVLLTIVCMCIPSPAAAAFGQPNVLDIQNFLTVLDNGENKDSDIARQPDLSSGIWGFADVMATVGKLFKHTLPMDAFEGDILGYKVTGGGESNLPSWLEFDESTNTLSGVPSPDDVGREHFLEVTAQSRFDNESLTPARDVFTVSVVEDKTSVSDTGAIPLRELNSGSGIKPIRCTEGSSITMVTIVADIDLNLMKPRQKVDLIGGMCKHLDIPTDVPRLLPMGDKPMFDSSALVAGPGDVKHPQFPGAILQWEVGCGNVYADHMPILQTLEQTSNDGRMSQAVGHGIVGWHVTNNRPHQVHHRMKRQAIMATPTLMPSIGPPTRQPVPTVIIDETDLPYTRVVPSMASPSFGGEIHPSHHHHHHHRTKTTGRHMHHHRTHTPKQSPKHHHKTRYPHTIMPTATLLPVMPTRTLDVIPTVLDTTMEWPQPTIGIYSPGISRTDHLEPSVSVVPPVRPGATEVLPTRTYIVPDVSTSEAVVPSQTDSQTPPTQVSPFGTTSPGGPTPPVWPTEEPFNYAPILKNDIHLIEVEVGDVLEFKVPKDTFYDFEDGNTENLKLVLLTVDGLTLPPDSWVKFNQTTQTLYGLPMPQHEDRQEYLMAAIDKQGKIARDAFEIEVSRRANVDRINFEFSVTLALEYEMFLLNVDQRIDVARKIAAAYGDRDLSNLVVTKIAPGSVVYSWTNKTMQTDDGSCPKAEIAKLRSQLMADNKTLNPKFVASMHPYRIEKAVSEPRGSCKDKGEVPVEADEEPMDKTEEVGAAPRDTTEEDLLISTVVPAVVIVVMLILAAIIACILYRRKRKGKLSDEDQQTFINRGIPIIFADELEEKPDPPTKPLILEDEKPPLPPPEYPHSRDVSAPSSPESDKKDGFYSTDDDRDDMTSPLYQPPPPVTGSRDRRHNRPRTQPAYRHPPPYVPP